MSVFNQAETPEAIAYNLMLHIALEEGKRNKNDGELKAERAWILGTYSACLAAVRKQDAQTTPQNASADSQK